MDTTTFLGDRLRAAAGAPPSPGPATAAGSDPSTVGPAPTTPTERTPAATAPPSFGIIVCEPDRSTMMTICDAVDEAAGLHVIAACTVGVQAIDLVRSSGAEALIIAAETVGISGYDIAVELHRSDPAFPIILVTHDREARQIARRHGLFGGVNRFKFAELTPVLDRLQRYLAHPERAHVDRRAGDDRRRRQVWACVTSQRRVGDERRTKDLPPEAWPVNVRYGD